MKEYEAGPYTKPGLYTIEIEFDDDIVEVWRVRVHGQTHVWETCLDRYIKEKPKKKDDK